MDLEDFCGMLLVIVCVFLIVGAFGALFGLLPVDPKVDVTRIDRTSTGELITMRVNGQEVQHFYQY